MYNFDYSKSLNHEKPPILSLMVFFLWLFGGLFLAEMVTIAFVVFPYSGFDTARSMEIIKSIDENCVNTLFCLAYQGVLSLVWFVIVPLLYLQFTEKKGLYHMSLPSINHKNQVSLFMIGLLIFFVVYPFGIKTAELTGNLVDSGFFGSFGEYMKDAEERNAALIESFLNYNGLKELLVLFLVLSVIPALGEELIFRGIIQSILVKTRINFHAAIWITAFIFSAMHLDLNAFILRLLLGALLGYTYYFSKNFFVPVFLHFSNNAITLVSSLIMKKQNMEENLEEYTVNWTIALFSLISVIILMFVFHKIAKKTTVVPIT